MIFPEDLNRDHAIEDGDSDFWNLRGAYNAQHRGFQQWDKAFNESWNEATWKNFKGLLPYGTEYDDPCEPSLPDFWYEKSGARQAWTSFNEASSDLAWDVRKLYEP